MNEIPLHLFRFFEKRDHALCFINGDIRLPSLKYCRNCEENRGDKAEGLQRIKYSNITQTTVSIHEHYILCASGPDVDIDKMKEKFGQFVVKISDPSSLLEWINVVWQNHRLSFEDNNHPAVLTRVIYCNKDDIQEPNPYFTPPPVFSQKPKNNGNNSFEEEKEYRYVLKCRFDRREVTDDKNKIKLVPTLNPPIYHLDHGLEDHITLKLADCRSICSLQD